jgi:hypothetical protein
MKKIEPAVQSFLINTPSTAAGITSTSYVDLSQVASLLNRRFYRQGINWAVSGMKVFTTVSSTITISKLPETWIMSNSWEKGFRAWMKMNNEALAETDSVRPRFMDYKIYADADHHTLGYAANLLPTNVLGGTPMQPGEWSPAVMEIPTGTAGGQGNTAGREIVAVGANYPGLGASGLDAVSLIEGYAASRGLPNVLDPNRPDDAEDTDGFNPDNWLAATFNEGTEQVAEVLGDLIENNNIAPYPFENDGVNGDTQYPNGANQFSGMQLHDFETVTGTTIGGITRIKGGMFPCGLIRIDHTPDGTSSNLAIQIDLVPGSHRGYLCEPMTDM